MQPLEDRVLIKRDPLPEKKIGSIYLPDENSVTKVSALGEVVNVGEKCKYVEVGWRVFFSRYATHPTPLGENMVLIKEDDILARMT